MFWNCETVCRNIKALHKESFESRREAGGFIVSNDWFTNAVLLAFLLSAKKEVRMSYYSIKQKLSICLIFKCFLSNDYYINKFLNTLREMIGLPVCIHLWTGAFTCSHWLGLMIEFVAVLEDSSVLSKGLLKRVDVWLARRTPILSGTDCIGTVMSSAMFEWTWQRASYTVTFDCQRFVRSTEQTIQHSPWSWEVALRDCLFLPFPTCNLCFRISWWRYKWFRFWFHYVE